jgi:hypothetical protein
MRVQSQGCRVFCLSLRIIQPIGEQNTGSSAYCSTKQCYPVSIPETPSSRQAPHEYRIFLASHRGFPSVFCAPGGGIPRVFCAPGGSTPLVFYTSSFHCSSCSGQFACLPLPPSWLIPSRPNCGHEKNHCICFFPRFVGIFVGPGKKTFRGFVAPIRNKKIYSWFKIFQQEAFCDFHQDIGIIFKLWILDVKGNFSVIYCLSDHLFKKMIQ